MSDEPVIHTVDFARVLTAEAVADSAESVIADCASDLIEKALHQFAHEGLTLLDFKITYQPHVITQREVIFRDPRALLEQWDLILTARGMAIGQGLASGRSL